MRFDSNLQQWVDDNGNPLTVQPPKPINNVPPIDSSLEGYNYLQSVNLSDQNTSALDLTKAQTNVFYPDFNPKTGDNIAVYISVFAVAVAGITATMIINAITESQANVHGYIESNAGSAASLIFLACDNWSVSDDAELFVHTSSSGSFGKESETYEASVFYRKKIHKMMRSRYAGFLTETEIDQVLKGADLYFDAEGITERLSRYTDYKETLLELELQDFIDSNNEIIDDFDEYEPVKKKKKLIS